jgi:hypothetical protein
MTEQANRNKKIDKITKKIRELDNICGSIYIILIASKSLRYNELYRSVIKLNPKQNSGKPFVSKPTFDEHLGHLIELNLILRKEIDKQNVVYSLNKDAMSIFSQNPEDDESIDEWINRINSFGKILEPFNAEKYYEKLTEKELGERIEVDLREVLKINLNELKAFVNYNLRIDEKESDAEFWRFVGNPLYRILEKNIAEKCRDSDRYRKTFFEKIKSLLDNASEIIIGEKK